MDKSGEAYWKAVLTLIAQVLAVWFFVSFGCGILFADALNSMQHRWLSAGLLVRTAGLNVCLCHSDLRLCEAHG